MAKVKELLGLEAISFQGKDSGLFTSLTEEIASIRAAGPVTDRSIICSGIDCIIKKYTNISTTWELCDSECPNAGVYPPDININHPLLLDYEREFKKGSTLTQMIKNTGQGKFLAVVDRDKGMVFGVYSQILCKAYITKGMLELKEISDASIAAILLHEVGHLFTFFEYMLDTVTTNYATATTVQQLLKTERVKDRVVILSQYEKVCNFTLDNKETIVSKDNAGVIFSMLMGSAVKNKRDITGANVYSYNCCEFVADQFAARHGAGFDLAKGLDVMYTSLKIPEKSSWVALALKPVYELLSFVLISGIFGVMATGAVIVAPISALIFVTLCLLVNPMGDLYDSPKDRVSRIIREYNVALKNRDISGEDRQYYLDQISGLNEIADSINVYKSWNELFWGYFVPAGKKIKKETEFQQGIEKLTNNSLFAASAQFK